MARLLTKRKTTKNQLIMFKKPVFFALFIVAVSTASFGQYQKVYFNDQSVEYEGLKIQISNIVALNFDVKFKFQIENTTGDFLYIDPSKFSFKINGKSYPSTDKAYFIAPYEKESKTIGVTSEGLGEVKEFIVAFDGLNNVVMSEAITGVEKFNLPPSSNDFVVDDFHLNLKSHKKESSKAYAKFDVQYKGDKVGFIFPNKVSVLMPDGISYATLNSKDKPVILLPGETSNFSANWSKMPGGRKNDMQLVLMKVELDKVFQEGEIKGLTPQTVEFKWNEALTIEKNK